MKNSAALAFLGLSLTGGLASAQQVTLYGLIDTGVEYISNAAGTNASVVRMPSQTGSLPSRWGVRGSEDLGNGLKAEFTMESGFAPDKGTNNTNQGGRLFGRQAWVGLSGKWGQVSLGRVYSQYWWVLSPADQLGGHIHGLAALDGYIAGPRVDNSIAYKGTFNGLTLFGHYSLGRDANSAATCAGELAGDYNACKSFSWMVKYDQPQWGAAVGQEVQRGGPGGTAGLTSSALKDTRKVLTAYGKLGNAMLSGGIIRRDNDGSPITGTLTRRTSLEFVEAGYSVTPALRVDGLLSQLRYLDSTDGAKAQLGVLRGTYALSKRTAVYASVARIVNNGSANLSVSTGALATDNASAAPGAARSQNGLMVGLRHAF